MPMEINFESSLNTYSLDGVPNSQKNSSSHERFTYNIPSEQVNSIKEISISNLNNLSHLMLENTSIESEILLENLQENYLKKSAILVNRGTSIEIYSLENAPLDLIESARKEERLFEADIDGNNLNAKGDDELKKVLLEAKETGKPINYIGSNGETTPVDNFTFTQFSEFEKKSLYSAAKVYVLFLQHQEVLNKLREDQEKEKEIRNQHSNQTPKYNQNNLEKIEVKEKINKAIPVKDVSNLSTTQNLKLEKKFLEIEQLKEAKIEEKEKKKLEKKLEERKFFEMNDLLRSILNQEMKNKDNVRVALRVIEIKRQFNLAPQIATCTLKSA